MSRFWIVMVVLAGAMAPLGCQSDPCDSRPGLFGRWRGFRQDTDNCGCTTSGCGCGSSLGTPVYSDGMVIGSSVPSGIPQPGAPSLILPGPVPNVGS